MKRISIYFVIASIFCIACNHQSKTKDNAKNIYYDKAFDYREEGLTDSAFKYFNRAKDLFLSRQDKFGAGKCLVNMAIISTAKNDNYGGQELALQAIAFFNVKDKKQHVYLSSNYNNLGIASYNIGDYQDALQFYDLAIKYSPSAAKTRMYLNNMANIYADRAIKLLEQNKDCFISNKDKIFFNRDTLRNIPSYMNK
ncbi:MAG: tetratricopeptide repeat protein [Pedobacter sp.]|nr:MAG: tetratricopeptide repeat protein [Pedobacter sp.]